MHAADRPEFEPPPQKGLLRSFVLAVLAHLLLVAALMHGLRWQRESQDAAVEAELWSAVPQQAAPKEIPQPPPPPPQPVVQAPPQPQPPLRSDADIALEREKKQRELEKERQAELQREREEQRRKLEAQKKREEELAKKKQQQEQQKLTEAKKKQEDERKAKQQQQAALDEKKRQQIREDNMKRMQAMAGTGAPSSTGTAARSGGPSGSWAGKVQARVRPNIVYTDDVSGNPTAEVEVRLGPGGMILGKPRLVKSSGQRAWDEAVLRALEKTESLPPDTDGRYPSPVIIQFKPKA